MEALLEFGRGIRQDPSRRQVTPWNPTSSSDSDACTIDWHCVVCSSGKILLIALGLWGMPACGCLQECRFQNLLLLNNKLEGVLPRASGSMTSLQHLDLSNNRFVGSIPAELARLSNLGHLSISSNGFGAALPLGFRNFRKLKYLDLHGNAFTGKLDDIFAQLQSPVNVDFSCNQFLESVTSIAHFQYFNVSHNLLSGAVFGSDPTPFLDILELILYLVLKTLSDTGEKA